MGRICEKKKEFKNKLFSIFVFLFYICLVIIFVVCQSYYHSKHKREGTEYIIDLYSARMETLISRLIEKTNILETVIVSNKGNINEETFEEIASSLLDNPGITSIQYLPNGVVTYCYPLEGNEKAIGDNILKDPNRKEDALYAKKTKQTFISGPYEFYQGGTGLTIRNPIYLSNNGEDKFLGFVVFTLKLPDLFEPLHFEGIERNGYYYRLYYKSVYNEKDITIIKESDKKTKNPMFFFISDIAARSWVLELSPTDGWIDWNTNIWVFMWGLLISILLTIIYIRRVQNRWLLHELEVEKKVLLLSLEQSDLNVFLYDPITKILEFKSQGCSARELDVHVKNVPESLVGSLILPEFEKEFLGIYQAISDGAEKASCVVKVCMEEKYLWERITLVNVPLVEKGWKNQIIGMAENITEEKENEYKLENERQYRQAMIAKALTWLEGDLTNNRMLSLDGEAVETSEDYETFFRKLVYDRVYIDDVPHILNMCSIEHLYTSYYQNGISNFQVEYRRLVNGSWIWSLGSIYLTLDTQTGALNMMLVVHDNDARKMEEIKLIYRAERDLLTGLYNRNTAENLIDDYIQNYRNDYKAALILIDLDNFKLVNDQMGHLKGDEVLQTVANVLKENFRSSDIISRLGGDEFVVFMKDLKDDAIIYSHMKQIVKKLYMKYENENISIQVSGSIGIALVPQHGEKFKELYKKADAALYHVKEESKNGYYIYREE